ncbi:MAG: hypothetical protein WD426_20335 [Anditalea sp.]
MLKKLCLLIFVLIGITPLLDAQITKEFIVDEKEGFNLVRFDFSSYKGTSYIKHKNSGQPLRVHAHLAKVNILPTFTHHISQGILNANIDHQNIESENLGKSLSYRLFSGSNEDFDHSWYIDLDTTFLYDLNFSLGIGKANFDLSNLSVSNCKIKSASADISLDYSNNTLNSVSMDTMMVMINMGTIDAKGINYSNAKNMFFNVDYGTLNLSFADNIPGGSTVLTMVGAGSVNIDLPSDSHPYIVKIKSTAMCRTSIPGNLKEIENKTYVSKGYKRNAANLMTFLIDISVGSVSLE